MYINNNVQEHFMSHFNRYVNIVFIVIFREI